MLPRFHGVVATNRGDGYVFDLIRDYDGNVARTLEYYFSKPEEMEEHAVALSRALDRLYEYQMCWKVVTMSLKAYNIVYQRTAIDEGRLVLVDNIGSSDCIPICNYLNFMAEYKIRRKWRRFGALLLKEYSDNSVVCLRFGRTPRARNASTISSVYCGLFRISR